MAIHVRLVLVLLILIGIALTWNDISDAQSPSFAWSVPIDISDPLTSGQDLFGVLLCDPYQNLHVLWGKGSEYGSAIFYRNDIEGIWSTPIDVIAIPDPYSVRLSAAISSSDGILHLIWQNHFVRGDVYYSRAPLPNAGASRAWIAPKILIPDVDSAEIHADAGGVVHIVFGASDDRRVEHGAYYMRSEDGGATWSDPTPTFVTIPAAPSTVNASMAVDQAGRIHVGVTIRSEEYAAYSEIGYVRSLDRGQTWSEYKKIDDVGTSFQGVSMLTPYEFGADEVHLTWHDPRRMHQWSFDGGDTWSESIEIMPLAAAFGGANELVKDSAGVLHVVTAVKDGVFSAAWDGSKWMPPEQIENRPMDPHGQRIAVCQGNQLHVVYDDRLGNETTVWYSRREVDAWHLKRQPFPAFGSQVDIVAVQGTRPIPVSPTSPEISPTATSHAVTLNLSSAVVAAKPTEALLIPMAAVLVLVGSVFVYQMMGRYRR